MMHLVFVTVLCGVVADVTAAPAIVSNGFTNSSSSETNDLERFSLPNFSDTSSDIDVNQTVNQVQEILKAYPSLPRLTNGEILTLLNNITAEDKLKNKKSSKTVAPKSKVANQSTKTKSNRSTDSKTLMVVLPYKAADTTNGDVTELYTKAPIIRYISTKSVVGANGDSDTSFTNHKYTTEETTNKNRYTLEDNYWHDQAQKVMNDLKKQSEKFLQKQHAQLENKTTETKLTEETLKVMDVKDIPFKRMPAFDDKLPIVTKDFTESIIGDDSVPGSIVQVDRPTETLLPDDVNDLLLSIDSQNKGEINEKYPFESISDSPSIDFTKNSEFTSKQESLYNPIQLDSLSIASDSSPYVDFKPLPIGKSTETAKQNQELDDLLKSYGIFESLNAEYLPIEAGNSEIGKIEDLKNTEFIQPDLFSADMTRMLTELGLTNKKGRKLTYLPAAEEGKTSNKKENNSDLDVNETDGYALGAGPDPMSAEEIYSVEDVENEMVKRQESSEVVSVKVIEVSNKEQKTSSEKPLSSSASNNNSDFNKINDSRESNLEDFSTSEVKDNKGLVDVSSIVVNEQPKLEDLESSFGASPADDDPSEAVLPPPQKNGFYYMLDWNSFLEVGDGDTKVNIRFNPKLGDPQRFLPVTVP